MKKLLLLLMVTLLFVGCSQETSQDKVSEDVSNMLKLQVVSYDSESRTLNAAELDKPEEVSYVISVKEGDLSLYKAGDKIDVDAEVIMESYPAQVQAKSVNIASELVECYEAVPVDFEVVNGGDFDENREEPGFEYIQTNDGNFLIVYMGMQNSGGYSISVTDILKAGDDYLVQVEEQVPGKDDMVTMAITYPYTVVKVKEELPKDKIKIERIKSSDDLSGLYTTPIDNFKVGDVLINGHIVAFEGSTIHVMSGCVIEIFEANPEDFKNFYIGQTVELVKSEDGVTIKDVIKTNFEDTGFKGPTASAHGRVVSVDGDRFTLETDDKKEIIFTGADYLAVAKDEVMLVEYNEYADSNQAFVVYRDSELIELRVLEIKRSDEGMMVLDTTNQEGNDLTHIVTIGYGTSIRLNLSEIKVGDTVKVYVEGMFAVFPNEVHPKRILK